MSGSELKRLRERRGWTQGRLADEIEMDRSSIAKWETEAVDIPRSRVRMLRLVLLEGAA